MRTERHLNGSPKSQNAAQPLGGQFLTRSPLRLIVGRPSQLIEALECGHCIPRPLSLGEDAMSPSKAKRRRCFKCEAEPRSLTQAPRHG